MDHSRPDARALMACLGDGSRFRLVRALIGGPRCVSDLAGEVGLSQSCTTRHLQVLERRRVVTGTRDGKRVLYRIRDDEPALVPLLEWALDAGGEGTSPRSGGRPGSGSAERSARGSTSKQAATVSVHRPGHAVPRSPEPEADSRAGEAVSATPLVSGASTTPSSTAVLGVRPGAVPDQAQRQKPATASIHETAIARRRRSSDIEDFLL